MHPTLIRQAHAPLRCDRDFSEMQNATLHKITPQSRSHVGTRQSANFQSAKLSKMFTDSHKQWLAEIDQDICG